MFDQHRAGKCPVTQLLCASISGAHVQVQPHQPEAGEGYGLEAACSVPGGALPPDAGATVVPTGVGLVEVWLPTGTAAAAGDVAAAGAAPSAGSPAGAAIAVSVRCRAWSRSLDIARGTE